MWRPAFKGAVGLFGVISEIDGLTASLMSAGICTTGILAVATFGAAVERHASYFSAFAVGMLSVAIAFHLIPETLEYSLAAVGWVLAGFAIMVAVGFAVKVLVGQNRHSAALTLGYASIIGLATHSFLDGIIYAAAFHDDDFTGWIATAGLLLHEFPEGIIAYFLLAQAGLSRVTAFFLAFLAAASTTVIGALAANLLIWLTSAPSMAAMLGGAAGALIYVVLVHLGPHAARAPKKRGYLFAQLGVAVGVAAIIANSFTHAH